MEISTTLLTSILSLVAIAGADFLVVFTIFKNNFRSLEDIAFANCWMLIGLMYSFMVVRTALFGVGLLSFDRAVAYIVQIFVVFVMAAIGYYVALISFENKTTRSIFYFLVFVLVVSFLGLYINFGLSEPKVSSWGTEYSAAWQANLVLMIGAFIAFVTSAYALIKTVRAYKEIGDTKKIIVIIALMLFIVFSAFEQLGNVGWHVLLVRILILVSTLTAYGAYELEKYKV